MRERVESSLDEQGRAYRRTIQQLLVGLVLGFVALAAIVLDRYQQEMDRCEGSAAHEQILREACYKQLFNAHVAMEKAAAATATCSELIVKEDSELKGVDATRWAHAIANAW